MPVCRFRDDRSLDEQIDGSHPFSDSFWVPSEVSYGSLIVHDNDIYSVTVHDIVIMTTTYTADCSVMGNRPLHLSRELSQDQAPTPPFQNRFDREASGSLQRYKSPDACAGSPTILTCESAPPPTLDLQLSLNCRIPELARAVPTPAGLQSTFEALLSSPLRFLSI